MRLHNPVVMLIVWLASVVKLNAFAVVLSLSYWDRFRYCVCSTAIQKCVLDLDVSNTEMRVTDIKRYNIIKQDNYSNYYVCYLNINQIICERQVLNDYFDTALLHFDNAYVCELACVGVGWRTSQNAFIDQTKQGMVNLGSVPAVCSSTMVTTTVRTAVKYVTSSTTLSQVTHNVTDKYRFVSQGKDSATGTIIGVIIGVVALVAVVSGSLFLWRRKKNNDKNVNQALTVNKTLESQTSTVVSCANETNILRTGANSFYELEHNLDKDTNLPVPFCGSNQENIVIESQANNYVPNVLKPPYSSNNEICNGDGQNKDLQNGVYSIAFCNAEETSSDPNEFILANKTYQNGINTDQPQSYATYCNVNNDLNSNNSNYSNVNNVASSLGKGLSIEINQPVLNCRDANIKKIETSQANNVYWKLGQESKDLHHPYNCLSDENNLLNTFKNSI